MINKYGGDAKRSHARIVNFGGCVAALTDCAIYSGIERLKNENNNDITIQSIKPGIMMKGKAEMSGGTTASWLNAMEEGTYSIFIYYLLIYFFIYK